MGEDFHGFLIHGFFAGQLFENGGSFAVLCASDKSETAVYHWAIWPMQSSRSRPAETSLRTPLNAAVAVAMAVTGSNMN